MISFLANAESNVTVTFHFPLPLQVTRAESLLRRTSSDLDEDELYLRRLDMGLFTLQLVDFIVAEACASAAGTVKQRVLKILGQRGANVMDIRNVLREYAGNLGDEGGEGDEEDREGERQYLLHLVDKF